MSTENSLYKILLVDDEQDILDFLSYNLKKEGFQVYAALNGKDAISIAKKENPHLIVLDVMMPEMDGIDTCREIREIANLKDVMIAFLSARNEDYSQIAGFEVGADDYITKPIKPRVFISRIKALLRRYAPEQQKLSQIDLGNIKIDNEKYCVYKDHQEIAFPKK
jgi:two-component system alkaline phosphatase synthesis response regulator PhoP